MRLFYTRHSGYVKYTDGERDQKKGDHPLTNHYPTRTDINLPALSEQMEATLGAITMALGIPRDVLAPSEEIAYAWRELPRELQGIPAETRNELIARMCVAIATGLFDSAINYAWNATIQHLKQRVREFGLNVVSRMLGEQFEDKDLLDLQDSRLLSLCLQLNLITEDSSFFLDQCRAMRNSFSAAHPAIGQINDREVITFVNRCVRYALSDTNAPVGIDVNEFVDAIHAGLFSDSQLHSWLDRLADTHDAQRQLLFVNLYGIYCDPASSQQARLNAFNLCDGYKQLLSTAIKSDLIDRHSSYLARGDDQRLEASRQFFEGLGLISLLAKPEKHSILASAVSKLWDVHMALNNFYNESPFAERLLELSEQEAIPDTVQEQFVDVIVGCYIGNEYGFSWSAAKSYEQMIRSFSPREVSYMVSIPQSKSLVAHRLQNTPRCQRRFSAALELIDKASVAPSARLRFERTMRQFQEPANEPN